MNAATFQVFKTLNVHFRNAYHLAAGNGDDDDLVQELALAQLSGKTPNFARAAARRFREGGQGPRFTVEIDDEINVPESCDLDFDDLNRDFGAIAHAEKIAEKFGVTKRRGYQIIAKQIKRAEDCGDLFAGAI